MHSSIGVMGKVVYLKIDIAKNSLKWHLILFVTHNVLLQWCYDDDTTTLKWGRTGF